MTAGLVYSLTALRTRQEAGPVKSNVSSLMFEVLLMYPIGDVADIELDSDGLYLVECLQRLFVGRAIGRVCCIKLDLLLGQIL